MLLLLHALVRAADQDGAFAGALACKSAFPLVGQCIYCMHPPYQQPVVFVFGMPIRLTAFRP